ncbi:hypothetical protein ACFSQD_10670 [Flavihumibacter stibioxidans]|uniref:FecR protein domain-containing protein n=1 Tax=Flavihumibacter stibioxidans TaxID=1834163 RepID=A0ABR7MBB2_9BACT|nr:hypothetical protein [Flavihumibacter stibioxidans]MBC6491916.1 hypothetical protein [Flavihumibacter stibioxidans]
MELENGSIAISGSPEHVDVKISQSVPNMRNETKTVTTSTLNVGPVLLFFPDMNNKTFEHVAIPRKMVLSSSAGSGSGTIKLVQSPSVSVSSSGVISSVIGNEIVIVYNDNETNVDRSEGEKTVATKSAGDLALVEALVDKDRKLSYRKVVSESRDKRAAYYLGNSIPNSASSIIFPIGKQGLGFNAWKTFYTNWCFLQIK